ncbi:SDR family NAD(P)-dependent oxidoreductase [Nonomuraea sp. B1E8]|uniref:SDR family NAD(P)-dependent oxidoreductase n=1 Tax=unclassified Nonomuraea TaxID=2593643 RepID=UPI00325F270D
MLVPGLGVSVARRFGREGFRLALVARRKDRLDAPVEQLAGEGIEAAAFTADLAAAAAKHYDADQLAALVALTAVMNAFNRVNIITAQPAPGSYQPGQW